MMNMFTTVARLLLAFLLFDALLLAGDDLFFVSDDVGQLVIQEADLLVNDPSGVAIGQVTDPAYGRLDFQGNEILYTPDDLFWVLGCDTFTYQVRTALSPNSENIFIVYLIADDGEIIVSEDFESGALGFEWYQVDPANALQIVPNNPIDGSWSLAIEVVSQAPSLAANKKPADPRCDGKVGHGLDTGGDDRRPNDTGQVVILRGLDSSENRSYELELAGKPDGPVLCPRAFQNDGTWVSAPCTSIPDSPVRIILGWGVLPAAAEIAEAADSNGFMYLLVDGQLRATIHNLDNGQRLPTEWQFGLVENRKRSFQGSIKLDNLTIWQNPVR